MVNENTAFKSKDLLPALISQSLANINQNDNNACTNENIVDNSSQSNFSKNLMGI